MNNTNLWLSRGKRPGRTGNVAVGSLVWFSVNGTVVIGYETLMDCQIRFARSPHYLKKWDEIGGTFSFLLVEGKDKSFPRVLELMT